jgi:hypothetical protein
MISPTDFYDEEIILLMKDNRSADALKIFINNEQFDEAETFCENNNEGTGLLTKLLEIYFKEYEKCQTETNKVFAKKADEWRSKALNLMRKHSSNDNLDALEVLDMIPEDWDLRSP